MVDKNRLNELKRMGLVMSDEEIDSIISKAMNHLEARSEAGQEINDDACLIGSGDHRGWKWQRPFDQPLDMIESIIEDELTDSDDVEEIDWARCSEGLGWDLPDFESRDWNETAHTWLDMQMIMSQMSHVGVLSRRVPYQDNRYDSETGDIYEATGVGVEYYTASENAGKVLDALNAFADRLKTYPRKEKSWQVEGGALDETGSWWSDDFSPACSRLAEQMARAEGLRQTINWEHCVLGIEGVLGIPRVQPFWVHQDHDDFPDREDGVLPIAERVHEVLEHVEHVHVVYGETLEYPRFVPWQLEVKRRYASEVLDATGQLALRLKNMLDNREQNKRSINPSR